MLGQILQKDCTYLLTLHVYHIWKVWLHPLVDCFNLREFLKFFCILFGHLTTGSYVAWISGVFCIPLGHLTTGSYVAWISGVFCIPFGHLTTGSYVAWISAVFCITFGHLTTGSYVAWISAVFCIPFGHLTTESYVAWISVVFCILFGYPTKMRDKKMFVLKIVWRKSIASLHHLTQDVQLANLRRTAGDPNWVHS